MNDGRAEERMGGNGQGILESDAAGVGCGALQTALLDLERALCRDRCHAVVSAPAGPGRRELLDALADRLSGSQEVVIVDPSLLDGGDVCSRILDVLEERSELDPEMRLLSVLQALGARGSALALLIDDAGSLPASTLRRLGRLAALSRPDLRLALVVVGERGASLTQVVGALGVSAEKVVLGSRPGEGETRVPLATAPPGPPELPQSAEERADEERALAAMRRAYRAGSGSARGLMAIGLGLCLALLGANQIAVHLNPLALESLHTAPKAAFPVEPMLARVAEADLAAAPTPVAALDPAAGMPPEVATRDEAEPGAPADVSTAPAPHALPQVLAAAASPQPRPVPAPPAAAPRAARKAPAPAEPKRSAARPTPVPVSVNARPWAQIEVDGRDFGLTPLGNVPLEPGSHRFRARLPDGRVMERTTDVDAERDHVVFP